MLDSFSMTQFLRYATADAAAAIVRGFPFPGPTESAACTPIKIIGQPPSIQRQITI